MVETEYIMDKTDTELDSLYRELGRAYYEGAFEDPLPQLLPLFDKISAELEKYKQIDPAPEPEMPAAAPVCPVCGTVIEEGTRFCAGCGANLEDATEMQEPAVPAEKRCPACGSVVSDDAKFCEECGMKLQ